ncbi:MAG: sulfite exporter TauE/SafE family protein [Elusimicrobia bacterium]|nr:sulfite exporter TauE/SafE family protein [Elusimicrobiota bacterium]
MENGTILLTAASLGFMHTVFGPDHYIPFVALAKARSWSGTRTAAVTLLCGLGHVLSSVAIGFAGIALGTALSRLQWVEAVRGDIAGWLLLLFGLGYMLWGIARARRGAHQHAHGHTHGHAEGAVTPWAIFIIFVFGPCEPLIPVLVYPAIKDGIWTALAAAGVFSAVTIATMLASVFLLLRGVSLLPAERMERYAHALAGFALFACGVAVKAGL